MFAVSPKFFSRLISFLLSILSFGLAFAWLISTSDLDLVVVPLGRFSLVLNFPEWRTTVKSFGFDYEPITVLLGLISSVYMSLLTDKGRDASVVDAPQYNPTPEQRRQQRQVILQKVQDTWIKGVLERSLYRDILIEFGLEEKTSMIASQPWDTVLQMPEKEDRLISASTSIYEAYQLVGHSLLILGEAGSGKTTAILSLARHLIDAYRSGADQWVPVIFNLSSWGEKRLPLGKWLIAELKANYCMPEKVVKGWIENDELAVLLDGLDEVEEAYRADCVRAINAFRSEHLMPLVVCCRRQEYEALDTQLLVQGAVLIQPLTRLQIQTYLSELGPDAEGLRTVLESDEILWEMAELPLMLGLMVLVYHSDRGTLVWMGHSPKESRRLLLDWYIRGMFTRIGRTKSDFYSLRESIYWLSWLAGKMTRSSESTFLIERVQPDWLDERKAIFILASIYLPSLLFGLAVWLVVRSSFGSVIGLGVGAFFGLLFGVGNSQLETTYVPYQGVWQSIKNALVLGLLVGLLFGAGFGLAIGLVAGLYFGLLFGLAFGGTAGIRHFTLRFILFLGGKIPWHYTRFLDYAVERIFLRKVGNGYIFVHRLLMEHFAALTDEDIIRLRQQT